MIIKNGGSIFFTDSYWTKSLEDENKKKINPFFGKGLKTL